MCKWAKIKAADVRQYINGSRKKRLWTQAFCGTVIITGFCPSVQRRREKIK